MHQKVQYALERLLYIWSIRHPATGYVQGMNDILTPFYLVFLNFAINNDTHSSDYQNLHLQTSQIDLLTEEIMLAIEADSYFCFSKIIDGVQSNFTFAQPGIQKMMYSLEELIFRIDSNLF